MKRISILSCVLVLGVAGCAAPPHRKPPEAPWHPATAMLLKYDTNRDGSVTRAEMDAGLRADFMAADLKHTGCLDEDETRAINQARYNEDQSTYSPLVDFKGKGCIDFDEFAATAKSLFDTLDRDNNGVLSPKELNPYGPATKPANGDSAGEHQGHHGHHGGGGTPPDSNGSGGN